MSQSQQEIGWVCPVDMCDDVYPNPIIALRHIYRSSGDGHGEVDSIPENGWPRQTRKEADVETANEEYKRWLRTEFENGEQLYNQLVDEEGLDLPPILTEFEMENFRLVEAHDEFQHDVQLLEHYIERLDRVLSNFIRQAESLKSQANESPEIDEEDEDEDEEIIVSDDSSGGRYSKADLMDAEEEEVFRFMERSGVLDDAGTDAKEAFKYIYKNRDEDDVEVDEIAQHLNCPPGAAADTVDLLVDRNLVDEDQSTDTFTYPY